jgi:5-methylcytosine-specific restriction endonuclease McrA
MTEYSFLPKSRKEAKISGSKRYFTSLECKKGHIAARLTSTGQCLECVRAQKLDWYHRNSEAELAKARKWKAENKKRCLSQSAKWRSKNREKVQEYKRRRYRALMITDPEKIRNRRRVWRAKNIERERMRERIKDRANPLARSLRENRRRARKLSADGSYNIADVSRIRSAQRDRCACCRVKLRGGGHLDHIVALSNGGSNWPSNLQWLCEHCNTSKSARDPIEFMQSRGRLL